MNWELVTTNFLNPPILFFFLGMAAVWVRSDLDVPQPLPRLFSLYLLLAIGFKGGVEIHRAGLSLQAGMVLLAGIVMAVVVPLYTYFILRRKFDTANAAAVAATYGSISAVTFIAATSYLSQLGLPFSGYMVAAMALMESPAIIIGVALVRMNRGAENGNGTVGPHGGFDWPMLLRDAIFNGSVFVLVGSLVIGVVTGEAGETALRPFTTDIFKGMLCLFLLDMGLVSGRRLGALRGFGSFPVLFGICVPLLNAGLGMVAASWLGLSAGDALLFVVLCASASYIAVPAAMQVAVPQANPGLYVTMALAVTFPLNIIVGLPLYMAAINWMWS